MPASAWRMTLACVGVERRRDDRGVELVRLLPARLHHVVEVAAERPALPSAVARRRHVA